MAFAQLTYRESLRDIEACLRSGQRKLYHMGFRGKVSRNTLAHANQGRDWRIYADFAQILIAQARRLYANDSLGSTWIKLPTRWTPRPSICACLFFRGPNSEPAKRREIAYPSGSSGSIPSLVIITHGKVHDVNILDQLIFEPGAFISSTAGIWISTAFMLSIKHPPSLLPEPRAISGFRRLYSRPVDKSTGVQADQIVLLEGFYSRKAYPDKLRRIRYFDTDQNKRLVFLLVGP